LRGLADQVEGGGADTARGFWLMRVLHSVWKLSCNHIYTTHTGGVNVRS